MPLFFPIIGAIAVLVLFAIVRRMYNSVVAFVASLIFATAFSHAFFTAAVTKETYASPIYQMLILIFLHPTIGRNKQILLFALASATLALTHHLTSLIAIMILTSIALGNFVNNTKNGVAPRKSDFMLILIPPLPLRFTMCSLQKLAWLCL
jgi:uncharacterized membrane protein